MIIIFIHLLFYQSKNDDFEYQDNQTIIEDSKELFKGKDFIMETGATSKVKRFNKMLLLNNFSLLRLLVIYASQNIIIQVNRS